MSDISTWSETASENNSPSPDGFPELMTRSGVNDSAREVMAALKRFYQEPTWRNQLYGATTLRVNGTEFWFVFPDKHEVSDQFPVNSMIKIIDGGSNVFIGHITAIAYVPANGIHIIQVEWQAHVSFNTTGPATPSAPTIYNWLQSGNIVYRSTGTSGENVPTIDDLDPHVLTAEASLDVGFVDGDSREDLIVAGAEGNLLTNGDMRIWQRQTTFPTIRNNNVSADCWTCVSDDPSGSTCQILRSTDVPAAANDARFTHSLRVEAQNITTPSYKSGVIQCVERANAYGAADVGTTELVSASLWAKSVGGLTTIRAYLINLKNVAPTNTPVSNFQSGTANVDVTFTAADWELVASTRLTLSTSWQRFEPFVGVSMDPNGLGSGAIAIAFIMDDGNTFGNGDAFLITGVQIVKDAKPCRFATRSLQEDLIRSYRYYECTYDWEAGAHPGTTGTNDGLRAHTNDQGDTVLNWDFKVPKFKVPTVVGHDVTSTGGGTTNPWEYNGANHAIGTSAGTRKNWYVTGTTMTRVNNVFAQIGLEAHANIWGDT